MPLKVLERIRDNSLLFRLLIAILLFSMVFTLVSTGVQVYIDYLTDLRLIDERLEQVGSSYIQGLSVSVWNIDTEMTGQLLHGIITLPDIVLAEVRDEENNVIISWGTPPQSRGITRVYPLLYESAMVKEVPIGTLIVSASLEDTLTRLRDRVFIVLSIQAVSTFLLAAFLVIIFQYFITRHLKTMADYARNLNLKGETRQLQLQRRRRNRSHLDELDRVTTAINEMISNIQASAREMQGRARLDGELSAAVKVQESFSPGEPPKLDDYQLAAGFFPAREISGDYYDYFLISPKHLAMVVADVSGKGISAAMFANIARVLLRDKIEQFIEPVEVLRAVNARLSLEIRGYTFLTMGYVLLDMEENTILYANAGHEPFLLIHGDGSGIDELKPPGFPFSELHAPKFNDRIGQEIYEMKPGDVLVCYTDGVTDAMNREEDFFGDDRFRDFLSKNAHRSADEIMSLLYQHIQEFQDNSEQNDDITVIILKRRVPV